MMSVTTFVVIAFVCVCATNANIQDDVERVLQNILHQNTHKLSSINLEEFLDHGDQFKDFVKEYSRQYDSDKEIEDRFNIFRDNLRTIDYYQQNELGTATYGVNRFADLTEAEFSYGLSPLDMSEVQRMTSSFDNYYYDNSSASSYGDGVAKKINFLEQGKVIPKVQDQHLCGSCWAQAAVATVESAYAIKYNKLIELSKQQVIDCDFYDGGCCGGWPTNAYAYIYTAGGIMAEEDYKQIIYEGPCKFDQKKVKAQVAGRYVISAQDDTTINENKYQKFMNDVGPLAAILNASGFRFYKGGIMNQPDALCSKHTYSLNHAVFNIGYDEEEVNGEKYTYWIIKNSWGPKWGEKGYIRIAKGFNVCGLGWIATGVAVK